MVLTKLIKRQLVAFSILGVGALGFTGVTYAKVPQTFGVGVDHVKVDFNDASGLYSSAIVTYRGVRIGQVTDLDLSREHAVATLRLDSDARVPRSAVAELHSTSAIGEQYIDLVPKSSGGPYLADGDTIPATQSRPMPQISPVLDRLNGLLADVPQGATERVLKELDGGLGGTGDDLGHLIDSSSDLIEVAQAQVAATKSLIGALDPVLQTQQKLAGATRGYAYSLAGVSTEVAENDQVLRDLLSTGPSALKRTTSLSNSLQVSLPVLLANMTTNAEVANVYLPNIQQSLATYPALMSRLQTVLNPRAKYGDARLDLRAAFNDPASCIKGYIPPNKRRSPTDATPRTAKVSYCELPNSASSGVRGARNYPCPNSNERAATSTLCGLEFDTRRGIANRVASFDSQSGQFYAPDGSTYSTVTNPKGGGGWQALLIGPLGLR